MKKRGIGWLGLGWRWAWSSSKALMLSCLAVFAATAVLVYPLRILSDQAGACLDDANSDASFREVLVEFPFDSKFEESEWAKLEKHMDGRLRMVPLTGAQHRDVTVKRKDGIKNIGLTLLPFHKGREPICRPLEDEKCPRLDQDDILVSKAVLDRLEGPWSKGADLSVIANDGDGPRYDLDLKGFLVGPWDNSRKAMVDARVLTRLADPELGIEGEQAGHEDFDHRGMRISIDDVDDLPRLEDWLIKELRIRTEDIETYRERRPEIEAWRRVRDFAHGWWEVGRWTVLAVWILTAFAFAQSHLGAIGEDILELRDLGWRRRHLFCAAMLPLVVVISVIPVAGFILSQHWFAYQAEHAPCAVKELHTGMWALGGAPSGLHSTPMLWHWVVLWSSTLFAGALYFGVKLCKLGRSGHSV